MTYSPSQVTVMAQIEKKKKIPTATNAPLASEFFHYLYRDIEIQKIIKVYHHSQKVPF